jgi:hypothetical protein
MARTASTFALVAVLTALLAALSIMLTRHGYGFGITGTKRLDGIAGAATFIPLAALYFLGVALVVLLPLRAAAFVLVAGVDKLFWATVVLLATIAGYLLARAVLGSTQTLEALLDWQFVFAALVLACHAILNELRRNALLRGIALVASIAISLACLYWTFRL